jgi:hypothetical protein
MSIILDPITWGPHYWFFLHTIAISYPNFPNSITKKKYYDFIQNLSLFLPVESISKDFSNLLNEYPITPYLDNRESFVRWTWFIHNKINEKLEKPKISLDNFYKNYYENYKTKDTKFKELYKFRGKIIYFFIIILITIGVTFLYKF